MRFYLIRPQLDLSFCNIVVQLFISLADIFRVLQSEATKKFNLLFFFLIITTSKWAEA